MIEYKGLTYKLNKSGYYAYGKKGVRLHRVIWEETHGKIPKGFDIHHKDFNKQNNSIDNLECLSRSDHIRIHAQICNKRHLWHKSLEGRKALGEKSKKLWKSRQTKELTCSFCSKSFQAIQADRAKFCSTSCMDKSRYRSRVDFVDRTCVICNASFSCRKKDKTKTCGYKCGDRLRRKDF